MMIDAKQAREYAKKPVPMVQYKGSLEYILYEIELASKMGKYSVTLYFHPTIDVMEKLTSLGYKAEYLRKVSLVSPIKRVEISWNVTSLYNLS